MNKKNELHIAFSQVLADKMEKANVDFTLNIKPSISNLYRMWDYEAIKDGKTIYRTSLRNVIEEASDGYSLDELAKNYICRALRSYQNETYKQSLPLEKFIDSAYIFPFDPDENPEIEETVYTITPPWADNYIKCAIIYSDVYGSYRLATKEVVEEMKAKQCQKLVRESPDDSVFSETLYKAFDECLYLVTMGKIFDEPFAVGIKLHGLNAKGCEKIGYVPRKEEFIASITLDGGAENPSLLLTSGEMLKDACTHLEDEGMDGPYCICPLTNQILFIHNFDVNNPMSLALAEYELAIGFGDGEIDKDCLVSRKMYLYDPETEKIELVKRPEGTSEAFAKIAECLSAKKFE